MTTEHALRRVTKRSFEDAEARVRETLAEQGFGVLTEIDVKAVLKKKLDADFRPYRILGACNPGFAHRALTASLSIGTLLPCNVVLYQDDAGETVLEAVDPMSMLPTGTPELETIAQEVRARLVKALADV
ncbi:MAG: DUF302 domain-containing protein [Myxococcales bacterium]|nr:DUF302 domain-containing protein [Myxococcales bacterium]